MAITSLHLAKVLYAFTADSDGQLSVNSGEQLLVIEKPNQDWWKCRDIVTGEEGLVPASYLKDMTFKLRKGQQTMFLAIADFSSGVEGDLEFRAGDLIIGEKPVNDEWWEGRLALQPLNTTPRLFPLTFTVEVSLDNTSQLSILQQHDHYVPQQAPPFVGRVIADFEGRYNDELTLHSNEEVTVTSVIDENWYSGYTTRNKNQPGLFPKSFIEYVSPAASGNGSNGNTASDVPLSRTSRAMHREIFDEETTSPPGSLSPSSKYQPTTSQTQYQPTKAPEDFYQNVPTAQTTSPLPTVFEVSPQKPEQKSALSVDTSFTSNSGQSQSPSRYINFDEIFKEVKESESRQSLDQTYGNIPGTNGTSKPNTCRSTQPLQPTITNKYQGPVFDSRTLNQMSTSFSLDDIVRYEMQRAVIEKQVQPNPPSRPPPPLAPKQPQALPQQQQQAKDAFDFDNWAVQFPKNEQPSNNSARPRPTPSMGPAPAVPLLAPTQLPSRQNRSASLVTTSLQQPIFNSPASKTVEEPASTAQFLPAYKPARPPPVVRTEPPPLPSAQTAANNDKRAKVIDELISTEESYLADLELCVSVVSNTPVPAVGAGVACNLLPPGSSHPLLGNMSEVASCSRRLLEGLKAEVKKSPESQLIGSCFIRLASELETSYSRYCQHQPGAGAFLTRLNQVDATKSYVVKVTETMKQQRSSAFSLESILLKPVQRVLKYPLLLSELTRNTGPQHPDTEALASASGRLSTLTSRLNETRRRLDLVLKYRQSPSIAARLSKAMNVHTIRKKTARFSQRLSDTISFTPALNDEEFNKTESEFFAADKLFRQTVRSLQRWMEAYNEYTQAQRELASAVGEFTAGDVACPQFAVFREQWYRAFDPSATSNRVGKINALAIDPIRQIVDLFNGPNNIIKKRGDKLLDYRHLSSHQDGSNGTTDNELATARSDFVAINAQVLEELPSLCRYSYRILLLAFVAFFRHYSLISRASTVGFTPIPPPNDIITNSLSGALQQMTTFGFVKPDSTNKMASAAIIKKSSSRSSTDLLAPAPTTRSSLPSSFPATTSEPSPIIDSESSSKLRSKYGVNDLYMTTEPTVSRQALELALPSGALVGIVKRHDPTGQPDRWFVDTGVVKGFVPKKVLRPFTPSPSVDMMLLNLLD